VNSRRVLDGLLDGIGVGANEVGRRLSVLRAIDKADKFPPEDVKLLLTKGRKDESGDFTPGAGLAAEQAQLILQVFLGKVRHLEPQDGGPADFDFDAAKPDNDEQISAIRRAMSSAGADTSCLDDLREIADTCRAAGYSSDAVWIDPSVVRGLEYYTGAVFEAELLFETTDEAGRPVRFGSVGGGGRYDGLVGRFRGEDVPATGFSVGVSRLAAALAAREGAEATPGPVIVTVMDRDAVPAYQEMTAKLRAALNSNGAVVPVEMYVGDSGIRAQMKYADRRNAPCVVIQGSDERAAGKVQIKDLAAGKEASKDIADRREWVAARPAQFEVDADIDAIAAAVRAILGERA
jgi:histidyl-tRNA synthetase